VALVDMGFRPHKQVGAQVTRRLSQTLSGLAAFQLLLSDLENSTPG
jgi:hypothetical protein